MMDRLGEGWDGLEWDWRIDGWSDGWMVWIDGWIGRGAD